MMHNIHVGDTVFIYSAKLDEVIEGIVEGFTDERMLKVKVLQKVSDGYLRHIVSWVYVFHDRESAEEIRTEYMKRKLPHDELSYSLNHTDLEVGMTVKLKKSKYSSEYVTDDEGYPLIYQIIAISYNTKKFSLVTSYGESIGKYDWDLVVPHSKESIFSMKNHNIGDKVTWIVGDDVYEGIIINLRERTADITDVKKLMPVDYKTAVPYYKILEVSDNSPQILTTLIGDNLED